MLNKRELLIYAELPSSDYPNIVRVESDDEYFGQQARCVQANALFLLKVIREFETALLAFDDQQLVHGPVHSSIGQEAVAVGTTLGLREGDKVNSTHRAHHHFLAKALVHYAPPGFDPLTAELDGGLKRCVRKTFAEVLGLSEGWCGGRGGSMHLYDPESGNVGTNAIVGGGIPIASGAAFAEQFRATGNVALSYFGDGAVSIGSFHEGINLAAVWKLPAIFVIENNLYAVSTPNEEVSGSMDQALRAAGYNIPGIIVDGMDPLAMKRSVELARDHAAGGHGPVLIEAKTYRFLHQSGSLPGSAFGYRDKEEEDQWRARDPITAWPEALLERGCLDASQVERVSGLARALVEDATAYCADSIGEGQYAVKPALKPAGPSVLSGVRSDGSEFEGARFVTLDDFACRESLTMVQAISRVMARRMDTDPDVFTLGEDVSNLLGGVYGGTRDAMARHPERVLDTPISELGFVGLAHGAAMAGLKPIAEIMFPDFALVAADQLFNQAGTARHMYGGGVDSHLVVRARSSTGRGFGAQHSGDLVAFYAQSPGWRIVAPSTPFDYIGLFNAALRSRDPVYIIEHHLLYPVEGEVPQDDLDYLVAMDRAVVRRRGRDVTVAAYLHMTSRVAALADELEAEGISVEIIDLVGLDHAGMDFETLGRSIRKTGALVVVEQAMASQSLGPHIAAQVQCRFFDDLDHPVTLVASHDVPRPVSLELETFCLINDEDIRAAIVAAARRE